MARYRYGQRRTVERFAEFLKKKFGGEPEPLDDWIKREAKKARKDPKAIQCFTHEFLVSFPSDCLRGEMTRDGPREIDCKEAVQNIRDEMTKAFGGSTSWEGFGTWVEPSGKVDGEPVTIIEASHHCTDAKLATDVAKAVKKAGELTKQMSLSIKGTNRFLVIPTKKLDLP